jgi:DNA-binding transcriptional MerR regulator
MRAMNADGLHNQAQGSERRFLIGAFAKLTGVTERTLRFYDRKGLLKPSSRNEYGHRYYTERDLMQLQKILTLKYMDFSLEEIAAFISRPELDFGKTLAMQAEMLERKRKQLDHVLDTIGRIQQIVEGSDKVDADLMLLLIGSLQNEQEQKAWMAANMPGSFVNAIFMEDVEPDEKLAIERRMTKLLADLRELHKQGKDPLDEEVLMAGQNLLTMLLELVGPAMKGLSEQELARMEALHDPAI